jgi:hypothetical protein
MGNKPLKFVTVEARNGTEAGTGPWLWLMQIRSGPILTQRAAGQGLSLAKPQVAAVHGCIRLRCRDWRTFNWSIEINRQHLPLALTMRAPTVSKVCPKMPHQSPSAFASIRALRDEFRARLDESEDYRAWKLLDEVVRQLDPPTMPKAVDLAMDAIGAASSGLSPVGPGG